MSKQIRFDVARTGTTYVVRRLEGTVWQMGKHTGSIRTVSRHASAADAERHARALERRDQRNQPSDETK